MKRYKVEMIRDVSRKYYYIRDMETMEILELPTKYLTHKIKVNRSPNTVRRSAFAVLYYMEYLREKELEITDVYHLPYDEQTEHFVNFLYWLKAGSHTENVSDKQNKHPNNGTCNAYLKDVFRFYLFIEAEYEQYGNLRTLSYNRIVAVNEVGVKRVLRNHSFKGYLKEEESRGRSAKSDQIITILQACTNCRDQLLLLMLAETGCRIGEILGINYIKDIDYRNHIVKVYFREDNENDARAKNAEYRKAKISDDTFEFLMDYLAKYRKLLQHQSYLFINIMGESKGKPLKVASVYDMLNRMEKKTGIKLTPHMLRHYFANMRKDAGWRLEMISQALGHKHLDTTIRYLDWIDDELIEASNEFYEKHAAIYRADRLLQ
ncbi:MAG: tyrosine-type recombinase/integrase [Dorea sp.]|nr:tyrosine-type recombinase/integrase [Dorea sp.]